MWSIYAALITPISGPTCPQEISPTTVDNELAKLESSFANKDIEGVRQAYKNTFGKNKKLKKKDKCKTNQQPYTNK